MHLIVYTSEFNSSDYSIDEELDKIKSSAKKNNAEQEVTGVLFYHNGRFFQVLEGEKDVLDNLMLRLADDQRHSQIELLVDEPVSKRSFAAWNMDSFNLSKDDDLQSKELKRIANVYREVLMLRSDSLVAFYKQALATHDLR